jgi:transcriptional regulator with XRE-family HTH domain
MKDTVAALLREALRQADMTARQLAGRTGITEGRISDYLSGRHTPGSAQLLRMLAATGHGLAVCRDLDANGLVLPELLDLADAVAMDPGRPGRADQLPLFRELIAPRG